MLVEKLATKKRNPANDVLQNFSQNAVAGIEDILFLKPYDGFKDLLPRRLEFRVAKEIESLRGISGISPYGIVALYEDAHALILKFLDKKEELAALKAKYKKKMLTAFAKIFAFSAGIIAAGMELLEYFGFYRIDPVAKTSIAVMSSFALGYAYVSTASGTRASPITFGLPKPERQKYAEFRRSAIASLIEIYQKGAQAQNA